MATPIQDTLKTPLSEEMDPVIVTSTKTITKLGNTTVPVQLISEKTITQNGMLRLKDILQEQTGLFITNGFGAGVQMQGLNPDYTLILLNGEPMIGRTSGVLDLNRISFSNIKKIEIVKGPSSSLYGSEAMAGVVNIITDDNNQSNKIKAGIRYGFGNADKGWALPLGNNTFKSTDINFNISQHLKNGQFEYSLNAYYLDGLSYRPYSSLRIPQPIYRLSNQISYQSKISKKSTLIFQGRNGFDYIKQEFSVGNNGLYSNSYGHEKNNDINLRGEWKWDASKNFSNAFKIYSGIFNGGQYLKFSNKPDSSYTDEFIQHFYRVENQSEYKIGKTRNIWGAGYTIDQANSTRYDNIENRKINHIQFVFGQTEWRPSNKWVVIGGFRYDHNRLFKSAFSPKLSFNYHPNQKFSFKASIGRGFKAPDFRQLYLNFTNVAAGGYSVLGTIDAVRIIQEMQANGQILEIKEDYSKLKTLTPEFSTGINIGADLNLNRRIKLQLNLFRNDIESLIDVRQVATKTNGGQIFSYINIKNALTQGFETNINYRINNHFQTSFGYQYLYTADKDELNKIKSGSVYTRNTDGSSRLLTLKEYTGLSNRSKHMANFKLNYENNKGWFANIRLIYRSKWYVSDKDGNGVYNTLDEYADGFLLINCAAGKKLNPKTDLQFGMDNCTNYIDATYLPNLQGRMTYLSIHYNFK